MTSSLDMLSLMGMSDVQEAVWSECQRSRCGQVKILEKCHVQRLCKEEQTTLTGQAKKTSAREVMPKRWEESQEKAVTWMPRETASGPGDK